MIVNAILNEACVAVVPEYFVIVTRQELKSAESLSASLQIRSGSSAGLFFLHKLPYCATDHCQPHASTAVLLCAQALLNVRISLGSSSDKVL